MLLGKIDADSNSSQVIKGSLVKTNYGYLYLTIAFGKIVVDDKTIMAISPQSPIGIKLIGLREKDNISINGINYIIERVD